MPHGTNNYVCVYNSQLSPRQTDDDLATLSSSKSTRRGAVQCGAVQRHIQSRHPSRNLNHNSTHNSIRNPRHQSQTPFPFIRLTYESASDPGTTSSTHRHHGAAHACISHAGRNPRGHLRAGVAVWHRSRADGCLRRRHGRKAYRFGRRWCADARRY